MTDTWFGMKVWPSAQAMKTEGKGWGAYRNAEGKIQYVPKPATWNNLSTPTDQKREERRLFRNRLIEEYMRHPNEAVRTSLLQAYEKTRPHKKKKTKRASAVHEELRRVANRTARNAEKEALKRYAEGKRKLEKEIARVRKNKERENALAAKRKEAQRAGEYITSDGKKKYVLARLEAIRARAGRDISLNQAASMYDALKAKEESRTTAGEGVDMNTNALSKVYYVRDPDTLKLVKVTPEEVAAAGGNPLHAVVKKAKGSKYGFVTNSGTITYISKVALQRVKERIKNFSGRQLTNDEAARLYINSSRGSSSGGGYYNFAKNQFVGSGGNVVKGNIFAPSYRTAKLKKNSNEGSSSNNNGVLLRHNIANNVAARHGRGQLIAAAKTLEEQRKLVDKRLMDAMPPVTNLHTFQQWISGLYTIGGPLAARPLFTGNVGIANSPKTPKAQIDDQKGDGCVLSEKRWGDRQGKSLLVQQSVVFAMANMKAMGKVHTPGLLAIHSTGSGKTLTGLACIVAFWNAKTPDGGPYGIFPVSVRSNQKQQNLKKLGLEATRYFPWFRSTVPGLDEYPFAGTAQEAERQLRARLRLGHQTMRPAKKDGLTVPWKDISTLTDAHLTCSATTVVRDFLGYDAKVPDEKAIREGEIKKVEQKIEASKKKRLQNAKDAAALKQFEKTFAAEAKALRKQAEAKAEAEISKRKAEMKQRREEGVRTGGYVTTLKGQKLPIKHAVFIVDEIQMLLSPPPEEAGLKANFQEFLRMMREGRDPATTWVLGMTATPGETTEEVGQILRVIAARKDGFSTSESIAASAKGLISYAFTQGDLTHFADIRVVHECIPIESCEGPDMGYYHQLYLSTLHHLEETHENTKAFFDTGADNNGKKKKRYQSLPASTLWKNGKGSYATEYKSEKKSVFFKRVRQAAEFLRVSAATTIALPNSNNDDNNNNFANDNNNGKKPKVKKKRNDAVEELRLDDEGVIASIQEAAVNPHSAVIMSCIGCPVGANGNQRRSGRLTNQEQNRIERIRYDIMSPKIIGVVNSIMRENRHVHYVYSNNVDTLRYIAYFLETRYGFSRYRGAKKGGQDYRRYCIINKMGEVKSKLYDPLGKRYVHSPVVDKDTEIAAVVNKLSDKDRFDENAEGAVCRVILATGSNYKGVDLPNIRHVHMLTTLPDFMDIVQLVGRGPRNCGHRALKRQDRVVTFHFWKLVTSSKKYPSRLFPDIYVFNAGLKRYKDGYLSVEKALMSTSVDAALFGAYNESATKLRENLERRCERLPLPKKTTNLVNVSIVPNTQKRAGVKVKLQIRKPKPEVDYRNPKLIKNLEAEMAKKREAQKAKDNARKRKKNAENARLAAANKNYGAIRQKIARNIPATAKKIPDATTALKAVRQALRAFEKTLKNRYGAENAARIIREVKAKKVEKTTGPRKNVAKEDVATLKQLMKNERTMADKLDFLKRQQRILQGRLRAYSRLLKN